MHPKKKKEERVTPYVAGALTLPLSLYHKGIPILADVVSHLPQTTTRDMVKSFPVPSKYRNTSSRAYPSNNYGYDMRYAYQAAKKLGFPCSKLMFSDAHS